MLKDLKLFDNIDDIIKYSIKYKYALIYLLSEVKLIDWKDNAQKESIKWEEIIDARFFDKTGELHMFDYNGNIRATEVVDDNGKNEKKESIIREYVLSNKFKSIGTSIKVKQYISYDEDGQAYVELTRLTDVIRGMENGL